MNQKIVLLTAFFAFLFVNAYSQKSELKWQTSSLIIDGNETDWNQTGKNLRFYDSKNELYYDLRNDSDNLYLVLKSDNPFLQRQISLAGMKLKFTIKERTKRIATFTINPQKGTPERFSQQKREQSLDELARKEEIIPKDTAFLDGFQYAKGNILSGNKNLNEFSFDICKGRKATKTVFEILIPIRELFGKGFDLNQINQIPLQLQLSINAPSEDSNFGRGGMGREGGFGGGRMGGGGGRMDAGGGMGGEMGGNGPGREGGGEMSEGGQSRQGSRPEGMQSGNIMEKKDMKFEFYLTNKNNDKIL